MNATHFSAGPRKVGRNDTCSCGSGKKFKLCCLATDSGSSLDSHAKAVLSSSNLKPRLETLSLEVRRRQLAENWTEAIPFAQEIARLQANDPNAHHDLGLTLLYCGRLREATASFQRAVELRPNFESALHHLVDALEPQGCEAESALLCRKLSRIAGDPIIRRYYAAKALVMEGNRLGAEKELRRLLTLAPRQLNAQVLLARLLSERGMFEEAARILMEVVDASPETFRPLTEVMRITEAERPLVVRMQRIAEESNLKDLVRAPLHFGLGKAFDDLGNYGEAMWHYDAANSIKARSARLDRSELVEYFNRIIAKFSAETLAQAEQGTPHAHDELPVFVVGMPRSGTTLIEQTISSHPAVAAAGEQPFWTDRLEKWLRSATLPPDPLPLASACEDYRALLRRISPDAARVIDKMPRNFEALGLLRLALPRARFIHCRRHPVDTCLSIYFTNFWGSQVYAWDRGDIVFYYREYERLMDHWRTVLPGNRFTEVKYENFVVNQDTETRRLVSFIGLEWNDVCRRPEQNRRTVKTASMWQARQPVYTMSVERWRRYEPWLGELRDLFPVQDPAEEISPLRSGAARM
jgi:tetratricopeptide (TPR) repeat protein